MSNKAIYITIGIVLLILFIIYIISVMQKAAEEKARQQLFLNQQIGLGNIQYQPTAQGTGLGGLLKFVPFFL